LTAITALAQSGNNIVVASRVSESSRLIFTHRLAPFAIVTRFVESGDIGEVRKAIDDNTSAVFAESIASEGLLITDIEEISGVAHGLGVPLIM
jgi:O-acetylhomoserine (thiol)-lyase